MFIHYKPLQSLTTKIIIALIIAVQLMLPLQASAFGAVPAATDLAYDWKTLTTTQFITKYLAEPAVRLVVREAIKAITPETT